MQFIANLFFLSHSIGILLGHVAWIYFPQVLFIHPVIILSWKLNNNKCIISQLEYHMFGQTFLGNGEKYYVPKIARRLFYINFVTGIIVQNKYFINIIY